MYKRQVLLCVAMAAPLALGGISASAVEPRQSTYVINGGTDTAKVGDVISIQVDITENPGIITSRFEIGYDDTKLKFVSYSNGSVFQLAQLTEIAGSNADDYANAEEVIRVDNPQNPVTMYFSAGAARRNITKTGTMITLNFEVIAEGLSLIHIFMMHGYRGIAENDFGCGLDFYYRVSKSNVLMVDQRAHGKSRGRLITFGIRERFDCRDWAFFASKKCGANLPLYVACLLYTSCTQQAFRLQSQNIQARQ